MQILKSLFSSGMAKMMGNEIGNRHDRFFLELSQHPAGKFNVVQVVGVREQVVRAPFMFLQRLL